MKIGTRGQVFVLVSGSAIRRRKFKLVHVKLTGRKVIITRSVLERIYRGSPPVFSRKPVSLSRVYLCTASARLAYLRLISSLKALGYVPGWRMAASFKRVNRVR